ncbi:penicillin-binding transpeptidase domain-containing protein [Desulfobacula phenolica]|uniref:Penicillin binding protein transpeptidase domain-containing protein n=1 Tax=Desulfobacula phenolica TaxID=90732 RepID=A0A1H2DNG7_9BACT|nr:penicillin-binding transpeptidase domain-containing protein [Desulfobacula phenolica]SDT84435.1 Penicillin binding protein transpeptidase domain-containing protein [Desulfobacula phenolica]
MINNKKENSWRDFQSNYIVKKRKKKKNLTTIKVITGLVFLSILITGIWIFKIQAPGNKDAYSKTVKKTYTATLKKNPEDQTWLSKNQLNQIISTTKFTKTDKNIFFLDTPETSYKITTSIDVDLQEYLLSLLDRLKNLTRGKPQRIAFVVMEADTGKIIAMTGFDLENPNANPCIASNYPAASIFKIITASAAVETLGYTPGTPLYFNGNKYTLYKRQLKDVKNKYSCKISFSRAFAESVNPVFGKIGKNHLGEKRLESYADAFGFNQIIHSELPFFSGRFETNSSDYHLAELGCGFNTDTTISPLFGAMLISAVVNSGNIMLPSIVEHVTDPDGKIIYKNKQATYKKAIRPETATTMMQLMKRTVSKGTARKSFRGSSKDAVLSKLTIGGKTGSLYNKEHTVKYDWFTGFGNEKRTNRKIALSIVVGHRKYIGTKAGTYAKMILKKYFKKTYATAQL